jgi:putative transposase
MRSWALARRFGLAAPLAVAKGMKKISYKRSRFPPEIIRQAIWLYLRFALRFRDVEDLLAERGIILSYETVRRWVKHLGPTIAADLRRGRPKPHTAWHLDLDETGI